MTLPFLSGGDLFGWKTPSLFGWIERQEWYYISDLAGALRGMTTEIPLLVVLAIALVPFTAWLLWRTPFGLRLRSAGESPFAADSLGVGSTGSRRSPASPRGAAPASAVPARARDDRQLQGEPGRRPRLHRPRRPDLRQLATDRRARRLRPVRLRRRPRPARPRREVGRGLVLFLAVGALIGVLILLSRRMTAAAVTAMLAGLMILWFFATDEIPEEARVHHAPVLTLVVLVVAGRSLRPPKFDGTCGGGAKRVARRATRPAPSSGRAEGAPPRPSRRRPAPATTHRAGRPLRMGADRLPSTDPAALQAWFTRGAETGESCSTSPRSSTRSPCCRRPRRPRAGRRRGRRRPRRRRGRLRRGPLRPELHRRCRPAGAIEAVCAGLRRGEAEAAGGTISAHVICCAMRTEQALARDRRSSSTGCGPSSRQGGRVRPRRRRDRLPAVAPRRGAVVRPPAAPPQRHAPRQRAAGPRG